jgi:hypothetical protein
MLKRTDREPFVAYVREHPELEPRPVEGTRIAAMQYVDKGGKLKAQAVYTGVGADPVFVSYFIEEIPQ